MERILVLVRKNKNNNKKKEIDLNKDLRAKFAEKYNISINAIEIFHCNKWKPQEKTFHKKKAVGVDLIVNSDGTLVKLPNVVM